MLQKLLDRFGGYERNYSILALSHDGYPQRGEYSEGYAIKLKSTISLRHEYEVQELIGGGRDASVYRVVRLDDRANIALKVITQGRWENSAYERYKRNTKILDMLNRVDPLRFPAIVERGHDGNYRKPQGFVEGAYFFALPFIELPTLLHYSGSQKDPNKVIDALIFSLSTMSIMHRNGVLLRDVHPMQFFVDVEKGIALCTDFDLSSLVTEKPVGSRNDYDSAGYHKNSPEECNKKPLDQRSDVYPIGHLIVEAFYHIYGYPTGQPDFDYLHQLEQEGLWDLDTTSIGWASRNFPQPLIDIILNCSKENPSQRYQSIDGVVEDLARLHL